MGIEDRALDGVGRGVPARFDIALERRRRGPEGGRFFGRGPAGGALLEIRFERRIAKEGRPADDPGRRRQAAEIEGSLDLEDAGDVRAGRRRGGRRGIRGFEDRQLGLDKASQGGQGFSCIGSLGRETAGIVRLRVRGEQGEGAPEVGGDAGPGVDPGDLRTEPGRRLLDAARRAGVKAQGKGKDERALSRQGRP